MDKRHIDTLYEGRISDEMLVSLYEAYQPVGSGPLSTMRQLCALIEQLARERGIDLPPARGVK